jgi:hypothetical protein
MPVVTIPTEIPVAVTPTDLNAIEEVHEDTVDLSQVNDKDVDDELQHIEPIMIKEPKKSSSNIRKSEVWALYTDKGDHNYACKKCLTIIQNKPGWGTKKPSNTC